MKPRIDPRVDYAFKKVFGSETSMEILLDFLNALLNPALNRRMVALQLLNPFNEKDADDDKRSILDIKARDASGRQYNIEMQMKGTPTYPGRVLYYWAGLHRDQLAEGDDYVELRPTISISIVNDVLFPKIPEYHLAFELRETMHSELAFSDHIAMHVLELPKFNRKAEELTDSLEVWCYFLKHATDLDTDELPKTLDTPPVRQAMEVLNMMSQNDVERERYNARVKGERDYRSGLREAREGGINEGRLEGRLEGSLIARIRMCQRLLKQPLTAEADLIARPVSELQLQAQTLEQQLGLND